MATVWCPAQSQGGAQLSGDFWHDVREYVAAKPAVAALKERAGELAKYDVEMEIQLEYILG